MNDLLRQKLKDLPDKPGVYIMRDADGAIIYIGKAVVLKNRVRQYFHDGVKTEKVLRMTEKVADFEYVITGNELDALALESNLIKKHKPQYNILLKDDKARPYIKINLKADFPSLEITRRLKKDGARYFGPYYGGVNAKEVLELIKGAYPVRTCKLDLSRARKNHRECLNYSLGLCRAPCTRRCTAEEYRALTENIVAFLNGRDDNIEKTLREKMAAAAEREEFETAIRCRDRLAVLEKLKNKTVSDLPRALNLDVMAYAAGDSFSVISVLNVRGGKTLGVENFPIIDASLTVYQTLAAFIPQYYADRKKVPDEIVLPQEPEEKNALTEWLAGVSVERGKVNIFAPKAGVRRRLLEVAAGNAEDFLVKSADAVKRKEEFTSGAVVQLQKRLGLRRAPRRIECFDISNIGGTEQVASMAVFSDGEAARKDYRRFKIRTVEGADDFACMKEVLSRRIARAGDERFGLPPDLIVIDGGKGQLSAAYAAMRESGGDYEMLGLAKREEEIFLPGESEPRILPRTCGALKLLQRVRDEAHRFAITYHRALRTKTFERGFKKRKSTKKSAK